MGRMSVRRKISDPFRLHLISALTQARKGCLMLIPTYRSFCRAEAEVRIRKSPPLGSLGVVRASTSL